MLHRVVPWRRTRQVAVKPRDPGDVPSNRRHAHVREPFRDAPGPLVLAVAHARERQVRRERSVFDGNTRCSQATPELAVNRRQLAASGRRRPRPREALARSETCPDASSAMSNGAMSSAAGNSFVTAASSIVVEVSEKVDREVDVTRRGSNASSANHPRPRAASSASNASSPALAAVVRLDGEK